MLVPCRTCCGAPCYAATASRLASVSTPGWGCSPSPPHWWPRCWRCGPPAICWASEWYTAGSQLLPLRPRRNSFGQDIAKHSGERREFDQGRGPGAARMNVDALAVEHLEQRDSFDRITYDGNGHNGGQPSRMLAPATAALAK